MVQKPIEETYLANLPHCRVDPPAAVLQELGEQSPPPTPFHWEAAWRHSEFLQHTWDETIPTERDFFLKNFCILVYQTMLC